MKKQIIEFADNFCNNCIQENEFRTKNKNSCIIASELIILKKKSPMLHIQNKTIKCDKFEDKDQLLFDLK